ncbi:hypothetical protein CH373_08115 [Leptospira perolatii]|uniref:Uncharacterized protein n=2 Tax=Leptospira perolatii TaxID=2023191 RepID=A0A2M9ZNC6_9LEPT|nr:hypothetical protein CH360_13600 [Leptospira perolatii]PJZ73469.1 hypothetical protein CH373_08115 [Leptospira perolatii]
MFLEQFLGALGAKKLLFSGVANEFISGTVIYDLKNLEERQDFCWYKNIHDPLTSGLYDLIKLINDMQLLSIDMLTLTRNNLHSLYNSHYARTMSVDDFNTLVDSLVSIEVRMMDEGKETDSFFIHE